MYHFLKQQIVQSLWWRDFTSMTESAMVLHAQIQAAAVCCKSQSIPLFGRHAVFRFDVVGDLGILPRTCAQREVALLTAPDVEFVADQIRRDARQQLRRLLRGQRRLWRLLRRLVLSALFSSNKPPVLPVVFACFYFRVT